MTDIEKYCRIESIRELMEQEFIIFHGKLVHHGWFMNWSLAYADVQLCTGKLYYAAGRRTMKYE